MSDPNARGQLALGLHASSRSQPSLEGGSRHSCYCQEPSEQEAGSSACAKYQQRDNRPGGLPLFLLFLPEALGNSPTVIPECCCFRSRATATPGAPTYPGKGPEALKDGSVACAAAQVSWGQRKKAALRAQAPGQGRGLWLCSWLSKTLNLLILFSLPGTPRPPFIPDFKTSNASSRKPS